MPLVNLIHEQRTESRRARVRQRILGASFLGVSIIGLGTWTVLWLGVQGLRAEEHSLKLRRERMEPILQAIDASNSQYNILSPRLATLETASMTTKRWASILDHVSRSCPDGLWLTGIRASQANDEEPIVIEFQGKGPSQEKISELILRVQSCQDLESVNLKFTQADTVGDQRAIRFEVSGSIVGSAKPKEVEKKDSKEGEKA